MPSASGLLQIAPTDARDLYRRYMPFVKHGGLYVSITGNQRFDLGDEVLLMVKLPGTDDRTPAVGHVVLVHRSNTVSRPGGVGVQFSDTNENADLRDRIETIVAGTPRNTRTYTL